MASPMLLSENTTEAIKCWLTTSFPHVRIKKWPCTWVCPLTYSRLHTPSIIPSPTQTSHPFYYPFLLHQSLPLLLPDHPPNTQTHSNISHLGKQHHVPHSSTSQKPPNSFLPSPLISNPSTNPVNSVSQIYLKSIHFSLSSLPPP